MEWKDVSSYSRGDKERKPKAWEFRAGGLRIAVHKHIYFPDGEWVLTCDPFFDKHALSFDAEESKKTALALVARKLREPLDVIREYESLQNQSIESEAEND